MGSRSLSSLPSTLCEAVFGVRGTTLVDERFIILVWLLAKQSHVEQYISLKRKDYFMTLADYDQRHLLLVFGGKTVPTSRITLRRIHATGLQENILSRSNPVLFIILENLQES